MMLFNSSDPDDARRPTHAQEHLPLSAKRSRNSFRSSFRPFLPSLPPPLPPPLPQLRHPRRRSPTRSFTGSIPPSRQRWDGSELVWPVRMGGSTLSSSSTRGVSLTCRSRRRRRVVVAKVGSGKGSMYYCETAVWCEVEKGAQTALRQRPPRTSRSLLLFFAFHDSLYRFTAYNPTTCILDRRLVDPALLLSTSVSALPLPPRPRCSRHLASTADALTRL
jgi:hypothetical protein